MSKLGQIVIYRHCVPVARERDMQVFCDDKRYLVDPAQMVEKAVGRNMSREGCIISMADGFRSANYLVVIQYANRHPQRYNGSYFATKLVYFLFGLAWIRGEWPALERQLLSYVLPDRRLQVLEHTASHYHGHPPYYPGMQIQIP